MTGFELKVFKFCLFSFLITRIVNIGQKIKKISHKLEKECENLFCTQISSRVLVLFYIIKFCINICFIQMLITFFY